MNRQIFLSSVSVVLISVLATGCSTMFGRQHNEQTVFFDANVEDVEITCSGRRTKTPGNLPLRQSKSHSCEAELEGYEKQVFRIKSGISGGGFGHSTAVNTATWGWWTLGIGTGVGWLIDSTSGSMKNLKQDAFFLNMELIGA